MRITNFNKISLGLLGMALIASCSIATSMDATIDREVAAATKLKEDSKIPTTPANDDLIKVKDEIWLGAMLLEELFRLKVDNPACPVEAKDDISKPMFWFMLFIMFILLMTFIKPLWFVIDE